jgi:hypothetical protein
VEKLIEKAEKADMTGGRYRATVRLQKRFLLFYFQYESMLSKRNISISSFQNYSIHNMQCNFGEGNHRVRNTNKSSQNMALRDNIPTTEQY